MLNNMHLKNRWGEFTFHANFEGEMCENVNVKLFFLNPMQMTFQQAWTLLYLFEWSIM